MSASSDANSLAPETLADRRAHYTAVAELLEATYGYPEWRQHLPPIDELVSTILSQNTSDTNRDMAFDALKERFASWEAVRDAPVDDVIETIRSAGLANQKGPRIQSALRTLTETQGSITLDFLDGMDINEARNWLTGLNGIGPKTAAIILLFAFNKPAFPVDTHVHRVTKRLGLIDPKTSAERAHRELEAIIPPDDYYPAHLNIIRHGRETCQARRPRCEECPLTAYCAYYQDRRDR
jgi:endonuclease-3